MNLDQKQWVLIQRYITENASTAEQKELESWMAESPENRRIVQEMKTVWNETPSEDFKVDVQYAWEQFRYRKQDNKIGAAPVAGYTRRKSRMPVYIFKIAAVLLVCLFAGLFVYSQMHIKERAESEQIATFNVLQQLETDKGEKAKITFSDGTQVTLNSASSVQFPNQFRGSTREVFLDGEAYFEVADNPDKPFIVNAQDARIEVLGTEFNVRGWSEDTSVEVVVGGGKVSVQSSSVEENKRSEILLSKGFKTELSRGQNPIKPIEVDIVRHLIWTSGGLHFDNKPFSQVVRQLERRFNISITVSDSSMMEIPYTGTFQYAELNEVLDVIATSMGVGYSQDGTEVEFGSKTRQ